MIEDFTQQGVIELTGRGMGKVTALSTINTNNLIIDGGQIIIKAAENIKKFTQVTQRLQHLVNGNEIKLKSSTKRIDIGAKSQLNLAKDFNLTQEDGLVDHSGQIAISTADEFKNIANNYSENYWLTNSIDLGTISEPNNFANPFRGKLDGAYNVLSSIWMLIMIKSNPIPNLGLFAELDNATVKKFTKNKRQFNLCFRK